MALVQDINGGKPYRESITVKAWPSQAAYERGDEPTPQTYSAWYEGDHEEITDPARIAELEASVQE